MPTSTLKILREVNDYKQDFVAEDILGISQTTYARLEQNPSKITAEQAQKLSDLYKVSIANLLSEATPVITFKSKAISENTNGTAGYVQSQNIETNDVVIKALQSQNEQLIKQNAELIELVKVLGGKLAKDDK
jgi:transcriptional regulator with XRE-family HTH domain